MLQIYIGVVGNSQADWRIIYISLTVTVNLLSTGLILFRIVRVTGVGQARTYRGVIEILVESAILYSLAHLIYLAMYVHGIHSRHLETGDFYPNALLPAVTVSFLFVHGS